MKYKSPWLFGPRVAGVEDGGTVGGKRVYPKTFSRKKFRRNYPAGKFKDNPKLALVGTQHKICTAQKQSIQRRLLSSPARKQISVRKVSVPNEHKPKGPSEKSVNVSGTKCKNEDTSTAENRLKMGTLKAKYEGSDFGSCKHPISNPIPFDVDREKQKPTTKLQPLLQCRLSLIEKLA